MTDSTPPPRIELRYLDNGKTFQVVHPFGYWDGPAYVEIPGYPVYDEGAQPPQSTTDLASVPSMLWGVIASYGRQLRPALLHDRMCDLAKARNAAGDLTGARQYRERADRIFYQNLRKRGVPFTRSRIFWAGVSFGRFLDYHKLLRWLLIGQVAVGSLMGLRAVVQNLRTGSDDQLTDPTPWCVFACAMGGSFLLSAWVSSWRNGHLLAGAVGGLATTGAAWVYASVLGPTAEVSALLGLGFLLASLFALWWRDWAIPLGAVAIAAVCWLLFTQIGPHWLSDAGTLSVVAAASLAACLLWLGNAPVPLIGSLVVPIVGPVLVVTFIARVLLAVPDRIAWCVQRSDEEGPGTDPFILNHG